jgi:capsular polysaccharide biosynthesis protein
MSLTDYWRILRRRGWIIVLVALLTAVSAYVFSTLQTPVYKSTAYIGVVPARPDFGLTQSAKSLLRLYVFWMQSHNNAQKVIDELQLDLTPEALLSQASIASDDSRFVIQLDVKNPNGEEANRIAQYWAELFVQWRESQNAEARREDRVSAFIQDPPRYSLFRPQKRINTLAGGILGLLLGGVIVFVLEYLESGIIRSPQELERALPKVSVVGAIPRLEASRRKG